MAVQTIPFYARRPGIAFPAQGQGIDVDVAIQHQAHPAPSPFEGGDGLEAAGLDLLQVHPIAPWVEEIRQKAGHRGLLGFKAGNADERTGQLDHCGLVHVGEYLLGQRVLHRGPSVRALRCGCGQILTQGRGSVYQHTPLIVGLQGGRSDHSRRRLDAGRWSAR